MLDAPRLKDDYYCSVLAYSNLSRTLAVALTHRVYLWTEQYGVRYAPISPVRPANYVMSLAFSSDIGGKAILAVARSSGNVTLWSLFDQKARFELDHPAATCSVSFKNQTTRRHLSHRGRDIECEDLLVGDDSGHIYFYAVEWPGHSVGSTTLLVKLNAHSQNICGLVWSPDGRTFVSGGNDNSAALFIVNDVLSARGSSHTADSLDARLGHISESSVVTRSNTLSTMSVQAHTSQRLAEEFSIDAIRAEDLNSSSQGERSSARIPHPRLPPTPPSSPPAKFQSGNRSVDVRAPGVSGMQEHVFRHSAAVKAIAYAPWQPTLLATGGGSNDRQIHFHHTDSGTTLAVINVSAQVTSLVWSRTRREIAATFGYAQPDHEIRVAVFAWPSCECVVSIPWERKANGEVGRALWAVPYPGGPNCAGPSRREHETSEGFDTWEDVRRREGRDRTQQEETTTGFDA